MRVVMAVTGRSLLSSSLGLVFLLERRFATLSALDTSQCSRVHGRCWSQRRSDVALSLAVQRPPSL